MEFFVKPGVKVGLYQWGILLSQQMSDVIKHITHDTFFLQEDIALVHMHCTCNTVQLLRLSRLPFS